MPLNYVGYALLPHLLILLGIMRPSYVAQLHHKLRVGNEEGVLEFVSLLSSHILSENRVGGKQPDIALPHYY